MNEKEKKKASLVAAINRVFSTSDGKVFLGILKDICCYQKKLIQGDASMGLDVSQGTIYNAAKRDIYLYIRQYIKPEILREVEIDG